MTIRLDDFRMKERIFPLQAGVPYVTRGGRRVVLVLGDRDGGALKDPETGYLYYGVDGYAFGSRLDDADIVDFHIEEGIWRTADGVELELRSSPDTSTSYPWLGFNPGTDDFIQSYTDGGYYLTDTTADVRDLVGYVGQPEEFSEPEGVLHSGYWRREDRAITYIKFRQTSGVFYDLRGNEYAPSLNGRLSAKRRNVADLVAPSTEEEFNAYVDSDVTTRNKSWITYIREGVIKYYEGELIEIPPAWQEFMVTWATLHFDNGFDPDALRGNSVLEDMETYPNEVSYRAEQFYLYRLWVVQNPRVHIYEIRPDNTLVAFRLVDGVVKTIITPASFVMGGVYRSALQPRFHTPPYTLRLYNNPRISSPAEGCTYNPLTNWHAEMEREVENKEVDGDYTPMPEGFPTKWGTGVHISTQNANLLAYYPTFKHWQRRVPQQIKPGRYIRQFFPRYSDDEVRRFAAEIGTGDLKFYSDWRDMLRIYRALDIDGIVSSCMSKDSWGFMHPLMVYHKSEVGLAVLYMGDKPVARALYNKTNNHFPMIYGQWEKMAVAMRQAGFVHGSMCGAVIKRLPRRVYDRKLEEAGITRDNLDLDTIWDYTADSDTLLMPYIDHERELDRSHNCSTNVDVYDDHIVIRYNGEYEANNHDGAYINLTNTRCTCDHCGDHTDEDDTYWVEYDEINVCRYCWDHAVVYVRTTRNNSFTALDTSADRNHIYINRVGYFADNEAVSDAGYCYSEADGEWYHENDCVFVEELEDYVHDSEVGKTIMWDEVVGEFVTIETYNEREAEREAEREQSEAA